MAPSASALEIEFRDSENNKIDLNEVVHLEIVFHIDEDNPLTGIVFNERGEDITDQLTSFSMTAYRSSFYGHSISARRCGFVLTMQVTFATFQGPIVSALFNCVCGRQVPGRLDFFGMTANGGFFYQGSVVC